MSGEVIRTTMYLERIELEVAVTLCPGIYAAELEFYDVNSTIAKGPYLPHSSIVLGPIEFVDLVNRPDDVRYPFTAYLPCQFFTHLEPDAMRYIEINARAWFGSTHFPKPFPSSWSGALPKLILSNAYTSLAVSIGPTLAPHVTHLLKPLQEPFSRIPLLS
jgi:hypothetical protein